MKKSGSLCLLLFSVLPFTRGQESTNYFLNAKIGTAMPVQGSYLKNNWHAGPYFCLDIVKRSNPVNFIAGFDYNYLSLGGDKIQFITPHLGINRDFNKDRFHLTPSANIGYSWFNYTFGKDVIAVPPIDAKEYHQNGFSASLDLKFSYDISDKFQIGIGDSYMNIFESFGTGTPKPDDSKFTVLNMPYFSLVFNI